MHRCIGLRTWHNRRKGLARAKKLLKIENYLNESPGIFALNPDSTDPKEYDLIMSMLDMDSDVLRKKMAILKQMRRRKQSDIRQAASRARAMKGFERN